MIALGRKGAPGHGDERPLQLTDQVGRDGRYGELGVTAIWHGSGRCRAKSAPIRGVAFVQVKPPGQPAIARPPCSMLRVAGSEHLRASMAHPRELQHLLSD